MVNWTQLTVRLPDDGSGALPLLRHIILNDDKSSTYKLALLRVLCRIADGALICNRKSQPEIARDMGLARGCDYNSEVVGGRCWIFPFREPHPAAQVGDFFQPATPAALAAAIRGCRKIVPRGVRS